MQKRSLKGCIWSLKFQLFLSSSPRKAPSNLSRRSWSTRLGLGSCQPVSAAWQAQESVFQTMCIEGRAIQGGKLGVLWMQLLKAWVCGGAVRALRQCEPRLHVMETQVSPENKGQ